jgi:hypothetical protein
MYMLYGKVNGRDQIVSSRIAGLHPAGDAENCYNCSVFNWTIGHIIPVPSETGASDGDLEEKYVTARYRVWMDRAHFMELDAFIRKLQRDNPTWNALWNNCVEFGRSVAGHMGLKMPLFAWQEPKDFVTALREMNGMTKEQLPLKDAATGWSRTAMRTPPLPRNRPKLETDPQPAVSDVAPVSSDPQAAAAEPKPASESQSAKAGDASAPVEPQAAAAEPKPAVPEESGPAASEADPTPAKPKKKPVVEITPPVDSASPARTVASTGSAAH